MSNLIVFENAEKIYSQGTPLEVRALRKINLEIPEGEFVYLLGPSGSGKTTLLNLAGLLDSPSSGKVFFKGSDVGGLPEKKAALIRNKFVGIVFQQPSFLPEFTAWENVLLPALIGGVSEKKAAERALRLFEDTMMSERRNHFPSQLSGGELQRLTILRALINEPEIILCDEPTGQLDEESARAVMRTLKDFVSGTGASALFVTHNRELTKDAKTVVNLRHGEIVNGEGVKRKTDN